jgi:hypothetical protein
LKKLLSGLLASKTMHTSSHTALQNDVSIKWLVVNKGTVFENLFPSKKIIVLESVSQIFLTNCFFCYWSTSTPYLSWLSGNLLQTML